MSQAGIAAQMYTVREFTKTPEGLAESLRKVKELGYEAVQLSGHGPIAPEELKNILDDVGIKVVATHIPYERLRDETDAVIAEHKLWGCDFVAIGGLPQEYRNRDGYYRFAKEASEVAKKLKEGGLTFGYHNHSFELEKFDGRTALEILYEESDPEVFTSELDTYWIQHGGGDPAQWIRKLKGRAHVVHFKDMVVIDNKPTFAEIGEGNLNWPSIIEACKEAGVKWYIVEQDICQRDPFESLGISFKNMKKMGL